MKKRYIIYIIIAILCIFAIGAGIYYQIISSRPERPATTNEEEPEVVAVTDDPDTLLKEFNSLLTNTFYSQGNDTSTIKKYQGLEEQEIVYAAYNIRQEKDGKYSVNINLPAVNIYTEVAAGFNNTTNKIFSTKLEKF